jgi:hypothetical protein
LAKREGGCAWRRGKGEEQGYLTLYTGVLSGSKTPMSFKQFMEDWTLVGSMIIKYLPECKKKSPREELELLDFLEFLEW